MTNPDTVLYRLTMNRAMRQARRKIHRLRRLVAGDISALNDNVTEGAMSGGSSAQETELRQFYKPLDDPPEFYDILVRDVKEGRSNKLFQGVRTLVLQTASTFPEIEFENLSPKMAALNSQYCKHRLMRCGARHHIRKAIADYIISGIGVTMISLMDDYPSVRWVDVMDMVWDQQAQFFGDVRWAAIKFTQSLSSWLDFYADGRKYDASCLKDLQKNSDADHVGDLPVSLWWYFDIDGPSGNHTVFLAKGEGVADEKPIYSGKNPYKRFYAGKSEPRVPFRWMYHLSLPSVKFPPSIVEMMLSSQIGRWKVDNYANQVLDLGKPFYEYEKGNYAVKNLNDWLDSEVGRSLEREKPGSQPMHIHEAMLLPEVVTRYGDKMDSEMVAQSGANPYSSGDKVEGIAYASEVQAIQSNSGLVSGTIAKDGAEYWQGVAMDFLSVGKQYDDMPFECQFDEDIVLSFGKGQPVRTFLKPDADLVIQEDTLQFMPKAQKIQQDMALLQVFTANPLMMQRYPNAVDQCLERLLRSAGVRNVASWLKPPETPQIAPGMAPPGMPPGMPGMPQGAPSDAVSSTAP